MSLNCRLTCLALLTSAIFAPALVPAQDQAVTAKIRLDSLSMIVVPVSINGSRPYDFLLDTGCSKSIIDRKLADELKLSRVGENTIVGILASAKMAVVHVDSVSLAGATVGGGEMFSADHPATVTGNVRGVLGEDFLQNFDVLLDYRHQSIRLEPPLGLMAQTATGEHLPLQVTHNRLIISARMKEFGDAPMSLLLDSAANHLTLFQDNPAPGASETESIKAGSFNQWVSSSAAIRRIRSLDLGSNSLPDVTAVTLTRRPDPDSDGLIPTSLFHSILISHRGGFVILNPSFPKTSSGEL